MANNKKACRWTATFEGDPEQQFAPQLTGLAPQVAGRAFPFGAEVESSSSRRQEQSRAKGDAHSRIFSLPS